MIAESDLAIEMIVIDGGSRDRSAAVAEAQGARLIRTEASRGVQLNAGYQAARGACLWLLHADSQPDPEGVRWLCMQDGIDWGRFDICFDADDPRMRLVAGMMNLRSRVTGICTGDQGLFVHRRLLVAVGGIPEQALMEDVELSRRLRRLCRPKCPDLTIRTSARRWHRDGWGKTVLSMWRFRLRYWLGASAEHLAQKYYPADTDP